MKISNFEYSSLGLLSHTQQIVDGAYALISEFGSALKSCLSKLFMQFKINRLSSALSSMSDNQLDKIGLSRKDIKLHAETLIKYEYDGL